MNAICTGSNIQVGTVSPYRVIYFYNFNFTVDFQWDNLRRTVSTHVT